MITIPNGAAAPMPRSLNIGQQAQQATAERLASGQRINRAADDAAGQAIVTQFAARIAENGMGMRNLNDGVSLVQTAEAGVSQVSDAMQRIRELSVQSGNGTLSGSDRAALQQEVGALREQVAQTAAQTQFNGIAPLAQSGSLSLAAGAGEDNALPIGTHDLQGQLNSLGFDTLDISTAAGAASALGVLDRAGDYLNGVRAEFGAAQNRIETAARGLETGNLNAAAAKGRIADADYASETAAQTGNAIRQQAGLAMMVQGNRATSQLVGSLLTG